MQRWFGTIVREGTRYNYRTAFRAYALFTGMSASALIDEALEDIRKDPRNRRDIALTRLVQFYNWLKSEYPRKSRGIGEHKIVGIGISDKLAHAYVNSIRSFYATYDVTVRMKGRHRLPRPKVLNKRMKVGAEQVKVLVDHARTPRDRAIILTLFQSGMDVSTLCSLKYGDVAEGLSKEEHPLKLELHRPKTGTEYYAFLGIDAVQALKDEGEYKGTFRTVGDKEHAEMIRLYIEEELGINKIAEVLGRSSRTPLVQIQSSDSEA